MLCGWRGRGLPDNLLLLLHLPGPHHFGLMLLLLGHLLLSYHLSLSLLLHLLLAHHDFCLALLLQLLVTLHFRLPPLLFVLELLPAADLLLFLNTASSGLPLPLLH
jgi:hypothetical protein